MTHKEKFNIAFQHRGFSLIEVLVALLVLSIGLLGLAALQTTSLQYNTGSYFRTQATFLAYDIIDRMRANTAAVVDSDNNGYDQPTTTNVIPPVNCDTTNCTSAQLALYDVRKWYDRIVAVLPQDATTTPPTIQIDANRRVTIRINWQERDLTKRQDWVIQL
ncbi:MAG: type IV pilus modification protein PilV [Sulfuricaulis sp.]|uniref:type IV pilus modification protein PilV n=1 Tax=Sulfuricaulis sp. TaxID=2003553 RepID=UPI0034A5017A